MTTKQKWAWGLGALAVIAIIYFWNDISKLWSSEGTERFGGVKTGDRAPINPCIGSDGLSVCPDTACVSIGGKAYCVPKKGSN